MEGVWRQWIADAPTRRKERGKHAWKSLAPVYGALRPDQCNRLVSRDYAARRMARGISAGTVIRELGMLRAALQWADRNTPADFEMPESPPPRDRHLSRAEYEALLAAAGHAHVRLFIILALATAGRASAILDLTWDRVDFDRGLIRLSAGGPGERTKGRATVPMTQRAREALKEADARRTCDYVIEWGGSNVSSIKKGFALACARAKLKGVTPHVLRHTSAVWLAEAGVPMEQIAAYLGHSDPTTTARIYARFSPTFLAGAAAALD